VKRALQVVGEPRDLLPSEPVFVTLGDRAVSVADAHDGLAAERFVACLRDAGATDADSHVEADFLVVIRVATQSAEARSHATRMEQTADVVLGSVRPAFARHLALRSTSQKKR